MLTERQVGEIAADASERIQKIALEACHRTNSDEQRYVILTQIAAGLFGAAGGQFQNLKPETTKEEASRATLAYIGSLLGAYVQ